MTNKVKIGNTKISITTGQIMSRVTAKQEAGDEVTERRKVIIPRAINPDGSITVEELPEESLRVEPDPGKITRSGDIVIKLSTPYDAAIVDETTEGCIVPSFCAIIRNDSEIDNGYLLAFLNSKECKAQLMRQVAGGVMTILSVGKIKNVDMPVPPLSRQVDIGNAFFESKAKINTIKRIMELEAKRNDALIEELVREA